MQAGFSTASPYAIENGFGAGMGLPNIKAVSDEMSLESSDEGTKLTMRFFKE
jgi:anti-sigma regulatory factor (Ser/Thr protein kinase)